jgi:hypothetical protein
MGSDKASNSFDQNLLSEVAERFSSGDADGILDGPSADSQL